MAESNKLKIPGHVDGDLEPNQKTLCDSKEVKRVYMRYIRND
jgi:hypothetical protein